MPKFETTRIVGHTAEQMFALVADIERYPEFVPLCQRLSVRGREKQSDGTEIMIADMSVAYGPVNETFVTRVILDFPNMLINATYLDGPFSHLDNLWQFENQQTGEANIASAVNFKIDYEFKSRTLGMLMGSMFDRAFRKFAEAFEARADKIYDTSSDKHV
ncbi:type II toxin-antitoxin system RatA family toxin [Pararhizobium sp. IMCC21322]|uniref:type II toxin-antitoxin system RatA family toxin n=1 Tax=Pararhizobium sp. IMCC21322 TaxID=3067903 RepID=UPI00274209A7|nr:SRPBCC family protein [Pararhizobium sp. IMCC21322]